MKRVIFQSLLLTFIFTNLSFANEVECKALKHILDKIENVQEIHKKIEYAQKKASETSNIMYAVSDHGRSDALSMITSPDYFDISKLSRELNNAIESKHKEVGLLLAQIETLSEVVKDCYGLEERLTDLE